MHGIINHFPRIPAIAVALGKIAAAWNTTLRVAGAALGSWVRWSIAQLDQQPPTFDQHDARSETLIDSIQKDAIRGKYDSELANTKQQGLHDCSPSRSDAESYAASKSEADRQRKTNIKSIPITDVCKLASSHNMAKDCDMFRDPEHGSFNVCFFVRFPSDGKKWVVRFPISPVLRST